MVLASVADVKLAEACRPNRVRTCRQFVNDGDKTNSSPRKARYKPLKPLRREGRIVFGEPVVTMLVWLFFSAARGCGCIGHPAFPAPLFRGLAAQQLGRFARRGIEELRPAAVMPRFKRGIQ